MHDVTWADSDQSNDPGEVVQIVFHFLALRNDDTCDVCIVNYSFLGNSPASEF